MIRDFNVSVKGSKYESLNVLDQRVLFQSLFQLFQFCSRKRLTFGTKRRGGEVGGESVSD